MGKAKTLGPEDIGYVVTWIQQPGPHMAAFWQTDRNADGTPRVENSIEAALKRIHPLNRKDAFIWLVLGDTLLWEVENPEKEQG